MNTLSSCLLVFLLLPLFWGGEKGVEGAKTDRYYHVAGIGPWNSPYSDFLSFAKFAAFLVNNNNNSEYADVFPNFQDILPDTTLILYPKYWRERGGRKERKERKKETEEEEEQRNRVEERQEKEWRGRKGRKERKEREGEDKREVQFPLFRPLAFFYPLLIFFNDLRGLSFSFPTYRTL